MLGSDALRHPRFRHLAAGGAIRTDDARGPNLAGYDHRGICRCLAIVLNRSRDIGRLCDHLPAIFEAIDFHLQRGCNQQSARFRIEHDQGDGRNRQTAACCKPRFRATALGLADR